MGDLLSKAFTKSAVTDEPAIHPGPKTRSPSETQANTPSNQQLSPPPLETPAVSDLPKEDRGDLLVRGLWSKGKYCVIDVRITDINNKTQRNTKPESVLKKHENEKKNKYLKACTEYRRDFTPFVLSTEGLLGREAKALLKHIAKLIAEKWDRPFSIISSYVKTRISIAITRAQHQCIRGARTSAKANSTPLWEDCAGLGHLRGNY